MSEQTTIQIRLAWWFSFFVAWLRLMEWLGIEFTDEQIEGAIKNAIRIRLRCTAQDRGEKGAAGVTAYVIRHLPHRWRSLQCSLKRKQK